MNIIICSHPRSGTHLAIDLIRNNISGYELPYISYKGIIKRDTQKLIKLGFRLKNHSRVFKTHLLPHNLQTHNQALQCVFDVISNESLFLYIYRDGRDVMVSDYIRKKKEGTIFHNMSFSEYLRKNYQSSLFNPIQIWIKHLLSWGPSKENIEYIDYYQLISSPLNFLNRVACTVNVAFRESNFYDMRLSVLEHKEPITRFGNGIVTQKGNSRTSIQFRKGIVGDYTNYFNQEDISYFYEVIYNVALDFDIEKNTNYFSMDWINSYAI